MSKLLIFTALFVVSLFSYSLDVGDEEGDESNYTYEIEMSASGSFDVYNWVSDKEIKKYAESEKVKKLIQVALRNKVGSGMTNSIGKCNEYVVKALNQAGLPAWTGKEAYYAVQVKDVASDFGYVNLLDKYPDMTSKDAPKGAILVYSASTNVSCKMPNGQGCGHVEIKTKNGYTDNTKEIFYVSDYSDYRPVDVDRRYKLTAIFIYPLK